VSDLASTAPPATSGTPVTQRSLAQMRATTQFGVIVFLASDVMLFAPFFAAYFLLRASNQPWPPDDAELATIRAGIFTAVLLASSFTLVASDRGAERGDDRVQRRWLLVTIALGAAFLANQIAEYATLPFTADDHAYGSAYWLLTGLHSCHVTAGLIAMGLLIVRSARSRSPAAISSWTGGISLFWHLVDAVWIFVFVTIWVIR
jgi:cytochrome c oxidase subunit 3